MRRLRESGQSLAEFALVFPILMLVMVGLIDGTRAVFAYNTVENAAREGARYGIVHGSSSLDPVGPGVNETNLVQYVGRYTRSFSTSDVTVTPSWPSGSNAIGSKVKVTVNYQYRPIFGQVLGIGALTLSASSVMVIVN